MCWYSVLLSCMHVIEMMLQLSVLGSNFLELDTDKTIRVLFLCIHLHFKEIMKCLLKHMFSLESNCVFTLLDLSMLSAGNEQFVWNSWKRLDCCP